MRARKTTGLLVALGAIVALMAPTSGQAATNGYLAQAGDGRGGEAPVLKGFVARDVMHDPTGFPIGSVPRSSARYIAYGTKTGGSVFFTTSADGSVWAEPSQVRIQVGTGPANPLVVSNAGRLAVTYVPGTVLPNGSQFMLVYAPATLSATELTEDPAFGFRTNNIRYAMSGDGGLFYNDTALLDDNFTTSSLVGAAGSFNEKILGPTDLMFLGRRSGTTNCLATTGVIPTAPFGCDFVMLYETQTGTTQHVSVAGGVFFSDIGLAMRGHTAPLLSEGSSWISQKVDHAHASVLNPAGCVNGTTAPTAGQANANCQIELSVSGSSTLPNSLCDSSSDNCRVGTARSTSNALTYALDQSEPSIGDAMAQLLGGSPSTTLTNLQRVSSNPGRYYFGSNSSASTNTHLAFEATVSGEAPRIAIAKPSDKYRSANVAGIEFLMNDDFGTNPGINLATLQMSIDGASTFGAGAVTMASTIVGAITTPGIRVKLDDATIALADGPHQLVINVKDNNGLAATKVLDFIIDLKAPTSLIARTSNSGYSYPLNSLFAEGTSTEIVPGSGLGEMRGTVRNPLGQSRTWSASPTKGDVFAGFTFDNVASDGSAWEWRWAVPSTDALFFAVPGTYVVEVRAVDLARNVELASTANTRSFPVL